MRHLMRSMLMACTIATVGLLAGCQDSSNSNANQGTTAPADTFVTETQTVLSLPEATADISEPNDIAALVETTPDHTEPMAVVF